jgi:hypothetical protein
MNQGNLPKPLFTITDYRWKYTLYAIICTALVLAGFLTFGAKERHWQFWMAEVVMAVFASGIIYMLLSPKYRFVGKKGPEFDAWLKEKEQALLQDHGKFTFDPNGFVFHANPKDIAVNWSEITRISCHLEDVVTNDDDLCLRIEYGDNHFLEFDEEVPGWMHFRQELVQALNISEDWQSELLNSGAKELIIYSKTATS